MKKLLLFTMLIPCIALGQGVNITSWKINTTGQKAQYYDGSNNVITLTDSAEIQKVCYNSDTIYIKASMLAGFIMGPWPGDPFVAGAQNNSYIFPKNPSYPSSKHQPKPVGLFGLQVNGDALFDDGDGKSYNTSTNKNSNNGAGYWNQIAWVAHISEVDAGNGHPDVSQVYHNHHNPIKFSSVTDGSQHSSIVGWAFDGWPIYGPFGYSSAMDNSSSIKRMTPSWQLRNITTRTTYYDGSVPAQAGPDVSASFPLGTYIEDYEYINGLGDLDYYNGRYCVTPEFPSGTYAYFLNTDVNGNPSYPNMVGPNFYGSVYMANFGASGGTATIKSGVTCYNPLATGIFNQQTDNKLNIEIYPNPANNVLNLNSNGNNISSISIINSKGERVYSSTQNLTNIDISFLTPGLYNILFQSDKTAESFSFVKQ